MSHCSITELADRPYWHNTTSVDLSHNEMTLIDLDAFTKIAEAATTLHLNNNKLTHLPAEVKYIKFKHHLTINLQENPWSCNCEHRWMRDWMVSMEISLSGMVCHSPAHLQGMSIAYLPQQLGDC